MTHLHFAHNHHALLSYKMGITRLQFFSNMFTMPGPEDDVFSSILSPTAHNDIASFVASHYHFSTLSKEPLFALQSRFLVTMVGVNKAGFPAQHESLAIWVKDKITLKTHEFNIERIPSDRDRDPSYSYPTRFADFCTFPDSENVFDSIQNALRGIKSMTFQATASLFAITTTETEALPLLPLTNVPDESESTSPLPHISMSVIDTITSSLIGAVALARKGSRSTSPQMIAVDSISGCRPHTLNVKDCIDHLKPVGLSLFDVVLLAQVVHEYAPIYGLFDNHCYMFASVVFHAIIKLYSPPASPLDPSHDSTEVSEPINANVIVLPKPAVFDSIHTLVSPPFSVSFLLP